MTTLGKRHRSNGSMRRTTSMSGFGVPSEEMGRQPTRVARGVSESPATPASMAPANVSGDMQRRHSGDFPVMQTAAFLKACRRCRRRLGPGRDTFIYMGEVAFCSFECRQAQMNMDELACFPSAAGSGGPDQAGNSGTVAASS